MSGSAGGRSSLGRRLPALGYDNFRLLFFATLGSGVGTWMATIALTVSDLNGALATGIHATLTLPAGTTVAASYSDRGPGLGQAHGDTAADTAVAASDKSDASA